MYEQDQNPNESSMYVYTWTRMKGSQQANTCTARDCEVKFTHTFNDKNKCVEMILDQHETNKH